MQGKREVLLSIWLGS